MLACRHPKQMPGTKQIRKYTLASDEATDDYLQHWLFMQMSLEKLDVEVKAVWRSRLNSKQVIAVLLFRERVDVNTRMNRYFDSQDFKNDMAGFDVGQIETVEVMNTDRSQNE